MRAFTRLGFAAAATVCSLMLLAGTATATRAIRLEPAGPITKTSEEFTITAFGGEIRITCRLVLRGSLEPQILKARVLPQGRVGQITSATAEGCRNFFGPAEVTFLIEAARPYNLRYGAFLGALPNITGLQFRKLAFAFKVTELFSSCLYNGPVPLLLAFPPVAEGGGARFNNETFVVPNAVPLVGGEGNCSPQMELSGRAKVTPGQTAILVQ
jgi:hypothetical protein